MLIILAVIIGLLLSTIPFLLYIKVIKPSQSPISEVRKKPWYSSFLVVSDVIIMYSLFGLFLWVKGYTTLILLKEAVHISETGGTNTLKYVDVIWDVPTMTLFAMFFGFWLGRNTIYRLTEK